MYSNKKFLFILAIAFVIALLIVAYLGGRVRRAEVEISDLYDRMQSLERSGAMLIEMVHTDAPALEDADTLIDRALEQFE